MLATYKKVSGPTEYLHLEQITGIYVPIYQDVHFPRRFQNFLCVSIHLLRKRKAHADMGGAWWTAHSSSEPVGAGPAHSPSLDGEVPAWARGAEVKEGLLHFKPHQRRRQSRCGHFGNSSHAESVSASPRPNRQCPHPGCTAPSLSGAMETRLLDRCCDLWTKASPPPRQHPLRVCKLKTKWLRGLVSQVGLPEEV